MNKQGQNKPDHNAPVFADHKPTGLKEAALKDYKERLIVDTERKHDGGR